MKLPIRTLFAIVIGLLIASVCMRVLADAAADRVARLGFVAIVSPSSITQGYTVDFYDRLRELG
jgi:hypothetical protein